MQNQTNSFIWDIAFLASVNPYTDIVRNNQTNQIMLRRVSSSENLPVMRALSAIRHPNLMTVYDARMMNGKCVSLCEFINGVTLEQSVENQGLFDENGARHILCQICDGLTALHNGGMVHRDIKPSNVMLENNGNVKIIDFDITRMTNSAKSRDTRILGTEGYASPEQFGFSQTDAKADIYSCGVLLNFLLTGKLPNEMLYRGKATDIISQCIEMDGKNRFESADELKKVLLGQKRFRRRQIRGLPGYRGGAGLKVLTTFLIMIWIFLLIMFVDLLSKNYTEHPKLFWGQLVLALDVLIFWSALPYCFFGDIFTLSNIISRKNPHNGKVVLNMLGVASIIAGFVLFILALWLS